MSKRKLSIEELKLWSRVAKTTRPMPNSASKNFSPSLTTKKIKPKSKHTIPSNFNPLSFQIGENSNISRSDDLKGTISHQLAAVPLRMDAKRHSKMKQGKFKPEATLDLHGMTIAQAHPKLINFVMSSYDMGMRLVLIITGKGKSSENYSHIHTPKGILRHQVPSWLRMAPIGHLILQVEQAHIKHGGTGAYYVYLRRQK